MPDPGRAAAGGILAVLAGFGGLGTAIARDLGPFADDVARNAPRLPDRPPRIPVPKVPTVAVPDRPPRAPIPPVIAQYPVPASPGVRIPDDEVDALLQEYVPFSVKESIRLVRAWQKGDDMEKAFGKTVCRFLSTVIDGQPEQDAWERGLRTEFAQTYSGAGSQQFANAVAPKIANGLWLMQQNSRAAYWYFQHCRFA